MSEYRQYLKCPLSALALLVSHLICIRKVLLLWFSSILWIVLDIEGMRLPLIRSSDV